MAWVIRNCPLKEVTFSERKNISCSLVVNIAIKTALFCEKQNEMKNIMDVVDVMLLYCFHAQGMLLYCFFMPKWCYTNLFYIFFVCGSSIYLGRSRHSRYFSSAWESELEILLLTLRLLSKTIVVPEFFLTSSIQPFWKLQLWGVAHRPTNFLRYVSHYIWCKCIKPS